LDHYTMPLAVVGGTAMFVCPEKSSGLLLWYTWVALIWLIGLTGVSVAVAHQPPQR
jgi:hypothetical protein